MCIKGIVKRLLDSHLRGNDYLYPHPNSLPEGEGQLATGAYMPGNPNPYPEGEGTYEWDYLIV